MWASGNMIDAEARAADAEVREAAKDKAAGVTTRTYVKKLAVKKRKEKLGRKAATTTQ